LPELSVIIPAYNCETSLSRALESVLAQKAEDVEILIIDDASDSPLQLPPNYSDNSCVRLLRHSANRGAAAARNTGLQNARGTWVAFLDSDDYWLPGTLTLRLAQARYAVGMGANPLLVHVAGFKYTRRQRNRVNILIPNPAYNPLDFALGCWFCPGSTALFLREPIVSRIGGQDERLRRFEDVDWFLRIALEGGGIVATPIVAAAVETGTRPTVSTVEREGRLLLQKFMSYSNQQLMRRLEAWFAFECASAHWHAGDYQATLIDLLRSWWLAPRGRLYLRKFWHNRALA
jgi:glycosyltransferase involved in cell wall biosynthesis